MRPDGCTSPEGRRLMWRTYPAPSGRASRTKADGLQEVLIKAPRCRGSGPQAPARLRPDVQNLRLSTPHLGVSWAEPGNYYNPQS